MEKVLVLGSNGMLGHKLVQVLQKDERVELYHTARENHLFDDFIPLDVTNTEEIVSLLKAIRPKFIINCCGVLIDGSYKDPVNAFHVNGALPLILDSLSHVFGFKLIQISTDCVFSGASGPYEVNSRKDGVDYYSFSKQLGERIGESNLIIRTSIVGPELKSNHTGLFEWFVQEASTGKPVKGFSNVYWSGLSTLCLSRIIRRLIYSDSKGVIQLTGTAPISKFDMLHLFRDKLNVDVVINRDDEKISNKSLIKNSDLLDDFIPSYDKMFEDLVKDYITSPWYKKT